MPTTDWCVLRVNAGTESRVVKRLKSWDGFDAFCPFAIERPMIRGRIVEQRRALWPSYCFAAWPRRDVSWHRMVGEDSELRLLGLWGVIGGSNPIRVPDAVVQEWVIRAGADGVIFDLAEKLEELRRGYKRGSEVRLLGGLWSGHVGTCEWVDDRGASIRLEVFGRDTPVYLPHAGETKVIGIAATSTAHLRQKPGRLSPPARGRHIRRKLQAMRAALAGNPTD